MEIEQKLTKIFSTKNKNVESLNKKLAASCQQFFTQSIEFRPAAGPDSHLEGLKAKYKPLNKVSVKPVTMETESTPTTSDPKTEFIPNPRHVLYNGTDLDMKWKRVRSIGSGLSNMGNTCFLNSVLQCLSYTPPLVNYLMSGEHQQSCKVTGFCVMCEFHKHCSKIMTITQHCIKPMAIVHNMKGIAKHFRLGRQEDAHEFLRYFIDGMQRSVLHGYPGKLDPHSKATTIIHQIFGGYHRSQVKCLECSKVSNTYDPLLDVSLDIKNCNTLLKALHKSIKPDLLEGDNCYACPFCKKMTRAQKRFTIQKLPRVLTLQLKRFDFNSTFGGKVNKTVEYQERVNMRPFMSNTQGSMEWYKLYAVLVHFGYSSNSGHYYCYVRNSNNSWYCMNDSQVSQVSQATVLSQEAYLLFYIREDNPGTSAPSQKQQQGVVRSDPNFLSPARGPSTSPLLSKPTGVVPPSPKMTPTKLATSTAPVSRESTPQRHVFVPRQIKSPALVKKRDKFKSKLITAPSLSPLPEESEDSRDTLPPDKPIPLASAIQTVAMETSSEADRGMAADYSTNPQFSVEQPGRIIGPMLPSPQRKSDEELTTSPRVALVSPQPQSGSKTGAGKPVARIRPTLHIGSTASPGKTESICSEPASSSATQKSPSSAVGSYGSHESQVTYGPALSSDQTTPEAKVEFNSSKHSKKYKKQYRRKSYSDATLGSDKRSSDFDKMSSSNNSESESNTRRHKHSRGKDHHRKSLSPIERKERHHNSKKKKYRNRSRSRSPGSKVRRSRSRSRSPGSKVQRRHTHHRRHTIHSWSPERAQHKSHHSEEEEYRRGKKRKSHHGEASPEGKRHKQEQSEKVSEVAWDASLKGQQSGGLAKWDGSKQTDVLDKLTSKDRGGMKTWEDGPSSLVGGASREEKRGGDSWDEELDKGKTKKVRRKSREDFGPSNKFQDYHDKRNSTGSHHKGHKSHKRHAHH